MKVFNLMLLAICGAMAASLAVSEILFNLMGDSSAFLAIPICFVIGLNARKIAEKILGYTLEDAMRGPDDEK